MIPYAEERLDGDPATSSRPYLRLRVRSLTGVQLPIMGVIDSGADETVLPLEFADDLGYRQRDLVRARFQLASGEARGYRAVHAVRAAVAVPSLDEYVFDLCPVFLPNSIDALWGRHDFFTAFQVTLHERDRQLALAPLIRAQPSSEHQASEKHV